MKTKSIYIGILMVCSVISSCEYERIRAEGEVTAREVNLSGYSSLKVSDAFDVYVQFSETEEKIVIEANENLHDKIRVDLEGNTLDIRFKDHYSIKGDATLKAYIITKSITNYEISGASKVVLESELVASDALIRLSGASGFEGELDVNLIELKAYGASTIDLFGSADSLDASLSGASTLSNYDLEVGALDIRLTGASDAYLTITESIDIDATGASKLSYRGDAIVNVKRLTGASEIVKK